MQGETQFGAVEVGDKLQRETGVWDDYEVTDIEETFGDRVAVRVTATNPNASNDSQQIKAPKFKHEFEVEEE